MPPTATVVIGMPAWVDTFFRPAARLAVIRPSCFVEAGLGNEFQVGDAGSHRDRVAGQGSGLVDRAGGGDEFHEIHFSAEGADRHARSDNLAEAGQIGGNAIKSLRSLGMNAEAGHDFIEQQGCTVNDHTGRASPEESRARAGCSSCCRQWARRPRRRCRPDTA